MIVFDWITLGVLTAAAVVVFGSVARQWGRLRRVDLDAMPQAKLRKRKYQLIESRLQRRAGSLRESLQKVIHPKGGSIGGTVHKWYDRLHRLERRYRSATVDATDSQGKEITRQKLSALIEEGQQAIKDDNSIEAEHIFLDAIRLSPQHVEAYQLLGEVYISKKQYDHAIETLEYAKHLSPKDDRIQYDLAVVFLDQNDLDTAMEYARAAVDIAPNHPKNLDLLVRVAIAKQDKLAAVDAFRKLKEANPENQKLTELNQQIKAI